MDFDRLPDVTGFDLHCLDGGEDFRRDVINLSDDDSREIVDGDDAAVVAEADEFRALDVAVHDRCGTTVEPDVVIAFTATERTVNEDAMEHRVRLAGAVAYCRSLDQRFAVRQSAATITTRPPIETHLKISRCALRDHGVSGSM